MAAKKKRRSVKNPPKASIPKTVWPKPAPAKPTRIGARRKKKK